MRKSLIKKMLVVFSISLLVLSGCSSSSSQQDASGTLIKAINKTKNADGIKGKFDLAEKIKYSGTTQSVRYICDYQMNGQKSKNIEMYMNGKISLLGSKYDFNAYIKDGTLYMDTNGNKVKSTSNVESLQNQGTVSTITKDMIKTSSIEKKGKSNKVEVTLTEKGIKKMFKENLGSSIDTSKLKIKKTSLEYMINSDGYISSTDMEMKASYTESSIKATMTITGKSKYNEYKKQDITFPDFSQYVVSQ